jgi:hypothetical protein
VPAPRTASSSPPTPISQPCSHSAARGSLRSSSSAAASNAAPTSKQRSCSPTSRPRTRPRRGSPLPFSSPAGFAFASCPSAADTEAKRVACFVKRQRLAGTRRVHETEHARASAITTRVRNAWICRNNVSTHARACTPVPPLDLHGKEGVNGSSPSEGSAKAPHVGAFAFRTTCS